MASRTRSRGGGGRRRAVAVALLLGGCAHPYDPWHDRKIPQPPKVVSWAHEMVLDASPEEIWGVLLDFEHYEDWNPFLVDGSGQAEVGARVDVTVALGDTHKTVWQRVYAVEPLRFCWRDGGATTVAVLGARCRTLTRLENGRTRYRQELVVGGPLRGTADRRHGDDLQQGIRAEARALALEIARRREAPAP